MDQPTDKVNTQQQNSAKCLGGACICRALVAGLSAPPHNQQTADAPCRVVQQDGGGASYPSCALPEVGAIQVGGACATGDGIPLPQKFWGRLGVCPVPVFYSPGWRWFAFISAGGAARGLRPRFREKSQVKRNTTPPNGAEVRA